MRILGFDVNWVGNGQPTAALMPPDYDLDVKAQTLTLDQLIQRLDMAFRTLSGVQVTPETALEAPTVAAIDRAIANRISTLPVHVLRKKMDSKGRETKEHLPSHPVQRLLNKPNDWQDTVEFWLDATSWLVRYGNCYAFKAQGVTGPVRRLEPLLPSSVRLEQEDDLRLTYHVTRSRGDIRDYTQRQVFHARSRATNTYQGDSPVMKVREAIAMELAAEKFGASFFGNGAMPLIMFEYLAGSMGHKTEDDRQRFIDEFQTAFTARNRFRAFLLPRGIKANDPIPLDNDKAQFLQTRKYQRTVIAGAFGVPPHLVGDLEKGTYNNVEQQSLDFVTNVVLPYVRIFEAAMERDLLTQDDRNGGVVIRFNIEGALRADFQTRQAGLKIQREAGVINPNEWREKEGMNPRDDEGGDEYWDEGPSGQGQATEPLGSTNGKPVREEAPVED